MKFKSNLLKDSLLLLTATSVLNITSYFFHFYMGRVLGPIDYGILGVILSLLYLITVPSMAIQLTITKIVSEFKAENQTSKISYLLTRSLKKLSIYGILLFLIFLLISPLIANYLKISVIHLLVLSPAIFFVLMLPINRGLLQGLQDFKNLGINISIEGLIKLFLGIFLVYVGFKVNGAIAALVLSITIPFMIAYFPLRKFFRIAAKKIDSKKVYLYSFPVLIALLSLTSFYTLDLILVKHFLTETEAGFYTAASLLGKVVFFVSFSIISIMFPKVTELYASKKPYKNILYKSMGIIILLSSFIILVYYLFPNLVVGILFGPSYLEISNLIILYAIAMAFFSLVYLIAFYNISINKPKVIYILLLFTLAEMVLINLYHNSLVQIMKIVLYLMLILFLILFTITKFSKNG